MSVPLSQKFAVMKYLARMRRNGAEKFPWVLMLEPTHRCNVSCDGCGRIREYADTMHLNMSLEECLAAVDECPAPVVSICGGEPTIYPHIADLVRGCVARGRFVYLCTNALTLKRTLDRYPKDEHLIINIHLDGLAKTHDMIMNLPGAFQRATEALTVAKEAGYRVCTNTTVFKESDPREIIELCRHLQGLGVEAMLLSPGFSYTAVKADIFLGREKIRETFRVIWEGVKDLELGNTPVYWDFLRGEKELQCTAWANPTRNPNGWKGPCYLITDAHHKTFQDLIRNTPWEKYGTGRDPRCAQCMVHCGYEASAIQAAGESLKDTWKMFKWSFLS